MQLTERRKREIAKRVQDFKDKDLPYWTDKNYKAFIDQKELINEINGYLKFKEYLNQIKGGYKPNTVKVIDNCINVLRFKLYDLRRKIKEYGCKTAKHNSRGLSKGHPAKKTTPRDTEFIEWYK